MSTRTVLFTNLGQLVTNDPSIGEGALGILERGAVLVHDGLVAWVGSTADIPEAAGDTVIDAGGRTALPGFVDSHAHPVFAGERAQEFALRMSGLPYTTGGILETVAATRRATDSELAANIDRVLAEAARSGTTTMECKSGYGLSVAEEERCLRVARTRSEETTFLGAHVVPPEYSGRSGDYVALVCGAMLQACAPHARWIDVFCDHGAFDADEAAAVLAAGDGQGLAARVHANQLGPGPGVRVAVEARAASADHCNHLSDGDVDLLASGTTVATLLPTCDFTLRAPYPQARRLLDAGVTVALATDCNPGTSYSTSMPFCIALAVRELHMTPEEALLAATLGGARALRRTDVGRLTPGARGDLVIINAPSHLHLPYRPGVDLVWGTWRRGERVDTSPNPTEWDKKNDPSGA
ncbi:MAG: imidazolonepropionase [Acidimicrobiales bacterium]